MYNKLFESDIDLSDITRKDWSSGLRRSASKHHEYAGYEFESHSGFFLSPIFFNSFHDFHEHYFIVHFDEFYTALFSHSTSTMRKYGKNLLKVMFLLREMIKQFQFFKML